MLDIQIDSTKKYLIAILGILDADRLTQSLYTFLTYFDKVIKLFILFGVIWFFILGPLIWYGVIQKFDLDKFRSDEEPSENDDLGQLDKWRQRAKLTDDEHQYAIRKAWEDRNKRTE